MIQDIQDILNKLGFSKSEVAMYIVVIQNGPSSVIQIAKHSGLTRQMVYTLLPRLEKESLLKEVLIGGKRLFTATDPKVLEDRVNVIARDVRYIIPELQMMQQERREVPLVTIYDNPISIRELYRRFMREAVTGEDVRLWVTNEVWMSTDEEYLRTFIHFKNKYKIHDRIIAPDTPASRAYAKKMFQPHSEYRFLNDWDVRSEKWLWRDMIIYLTLNNNQPYFIVIESPSLALTERVGFDRVWNTLSKK